jgi:uncharacterized membrane protein
MLVVFPLGLWVWAFIAYIVAAVAESPAWEITANYSLASGLVGGVLAAVPGSIDLMSLPYGQARRTAIYHMTVNVTSLVILAAVFFLRIYTEQLALSWVLLVVGVSLVMVGGYLGGHLVYHHGVGVSPAPRVDETTMSTDQDKRAA